MVVENLTRKQELKSFNKNFLELLENNSLFHRISSKKKYPSGNKRSNSYFPGYTNSHP